MTIEQWVASVFVVGSFPQKRTGDKRNAGIKNKCDENEYSSLFQLRCYVDGYSLGQVASNVYLSPEASICTP